jgi:hypothetical protein
MRSIAMKISQSGWMLGKRGNPGRVCTAFLLLSLGVLGACNCGGGADRLVLSDEPDAGLLEDPNPGTCEPACAADQVCQDGVCRPCTNDLAGCPCLEGACQGDVACDADTQLCRPKVRCADGLCATGQLCEEGASGQDAVCTTVCEGDLVWNPDVQRCEGAPEAETCESGGDQSVQALCATEGRYCVENEAGPMCGACLANHVEDDATGGDACRPVVECAALACAAENRTCIQSGIHSDASCGGCVPGFAEEQGACQALPPATCVAGQTDNIVDLCANLGRGCQEPTANAAFCGDCLSGLVPADPNDATSLCRAPLTCTDLIDMGVCAANEPCFEGDGLFDAACGDAPCAGPGEALRVDTNTCVSCPIADACGAPGETGRLWPFTLYQSNDCVCETQSGWFADLSGVGLPKPCDEDGDRWVRISARPAVESDDPTLKENARCSTLAIDRFVLQNELGQRLEVLSCEEGFTPAQTSSGAPQGCEFAGGANPSVIKGDAPIVLYESDRNDDPDLLVDLAFASQVPQWQAGANGRALSAAELNPLTKACVSPLADFNDNQRTDLDEFQGAPAAGNTDPALDAFGEFAYFMELHHGFFEPGANCDGLAVPDGTICGAFVIQEKSRCDSAFPLGYEDTANDYWQNCTRNRDGSYREDLASLGKEAAGFDFARYSCDQKNFSCPTPMPLVPPPTGSVKPPHGVCEVTVAADAPWRGMSHHSQFKCVAVDPTTSLGANGWAAQHRLSPAQLFDGQDGDYVLNQCHPTADPDQFGSGAIVSLAPNVQCEAVIAGEGSVLPEVAFASVRYRDFTRRADLPRYTRGCIDEWNAGNVGDAINTAWRDLCPGHAQSPGAVGGDGSPGAFGSLICGCGLNFGGPACDRPCPSRRLFFGGEDPFLCSNGYCAVNPSGGDGKIGAWMCADMEASVVPMGVSPTLDDGVGDGMGPRLEGAIRSIPFAGPRLCVDAECSGNGPVIY